MEQQMENLIKELELIMNDKTLSRGRRITASKRWVKLIFDLVIYRACKI